MRSTIPFLALVCVAASPRPEFVGAVAWHPACIGEGAQATRLAPRFCAATAAALVRAGRTGVTVAAPGDPVLGQPGHVAIGVTLADVAGGVAVAAVVSRVDRPSGRLYPAAPVLLAADADDAAVATAAGMMLRRLGL